MITEDYVSFEIAKLLKEKGFDEKCSHYWQDEISEYSITKEIHRWTDSVLANTEISASKRFSAPTLQMAMKWLRENFDIHCQIDCPIAASNWVFGIRDLNKDEWITLRNMGDYETYEKACEAGIRYVLENLI